MTTACARPTSAPPARLAAPPTLVDTAPAAPASCTAGTCLGWSAILLSGGQDPRGNAVAHESNVLFAARALARRAIGRERQTVLFADGADPRPDVNFEEPDAGERRRLYAVGLWRTASPESRGALMRERNNAIEGAQPADRARVLRALYDDSEIARRAFAPGGEPHAAGDLLLYVTDHGLRAKDDTNNIIVLWGERGLRVRELGAALDAQPSERRVVTVMAQCFSGSFAGLIYEGGDPSRPLGRGDRCGFFAAPADRPAAGCSPKTDESLYDDYTTRFFAAFGGVDRAGRAAPDADLDADGRVSFEEAHWAAVRDERTMDVPVQTSEEFLRARRAYWLAELADDERPIGALLASARRELRVTAASLAASIGALAASADALRGRCWPGLCEVERALPVARALAHRSLRAAASSLPPGDAPSVVAVLGPERADALAAAAEPNLSRLLALEAAADRLQLAAEDREARFERLRRVAELAALEARARGEGGALWAEYTRIRACETSGPWGRSAPGH